MFPNKNIFSFELNKSDLSARENALHLDCCFQPIGKNKAIIYEGGFKNYDDVLFITEKFGKSVYQEWKQDVLDDLDSLEEIVIAAKKNINRLIPSIVTSRRSKQLCELVDIEVVDDWAFLYPTK